MLIRIMKHGDLERTMKHDIDTEQLFVIRVNIFFR